MSSERKRRFLCKFCSRAMRVTPQGYLENPFCQKCYSERLAQASQGQVPRKWELRGRWLYSVPIVDPASERAE